MLTPSYLDALPGPILALYEEYIQSVLNDMARRLASGSIASAAWQMKRLTEGAMVYDTAIREMAKMSGKSEEELRKIFLDAGVKTLQFDDKIYRAAGLNPLPLNMSPAMVQMLKAGLDKTQGLMNNLTSTTAISSQQSFIHAADLAYLQVANGTLDYDTAIRRAIHSLSHEGIDVINYASGTQTAVDVAMRRTVLTGVAQTANRLQDYRADQMGVDLVQTSAHAGARPSHQAWQGQIFSRTGESPKYPNFVRATGYGSGSGLGGWNCRHSWYPFFEGLSDNAYSDAMLNEMNESKVTYKGKTMTQYDASQVQRHLETQIRNYKREANALKAAGLNNMEPINKVRELQAELRRFTRETGLDRQYVREGGRALVNRPPDAKGPPKPPVPPAPKPTPPPVPTEPPAPEPPFKPPTPEPTIPPAPEPPLRKWQVSDEIAQLIQADGIRPNPGDPDYKVSPSVKEKVNIVGAKKDLAVQAALNKIEEVHGDGPLPIADLKMKNSFGKNSTTFGDYGTGLRPTIRILRSTEREQEISTVLHEMGHFIDNKGLPGSGGRRYSSEMGLSFMKKWKDAVYKSDSVQELLKIQTGIKKTFTTAKGTFKYDKKFVRYLLEDKELFARSYAQYIIYKSEGDVPLRQYIVSRARRVYPQQWSYDDFKPIFDAFDEMFEELQWLK